MRVAAHFMEKYGYLNNEKFLVGNIGPDCGVPNEDWTAFTPDTVTTHWKTSEDTIDAEDFKRRFLRQADDRYPFYLGYYFHLLTDIEWSKLYLRKKAEPLYKSGLERDKSFIWTIKKDWYGQDHLFLQSHPDFVFFTIFSKLEAFPNDYFDFYPQDAFIRQIKYITNFYLTAREDPGREFPYLSKDEMDAFVRDTIKTIEGINNPPV